jgi:hypothetical protein
LIVEAEPLLTGGLQGDPDGLTKVFQPLYEGLDPRARVGEAYDISTTLALLIYDNGLVVALTDIDANEVHQFPPKDYDDR